MNRYLLDTNACIAMTKRNAGVWGRIREVGMESLSLTSGVNLPVAIGMQHH